MPELPPGGPPPDAHGMRIVRVFDAPREAVWDEWTQPDAFADWFGGADGEVPVSSMKMDVRPGGTWSATMLRPGGGEIYWFGRYLEVDKPGRLVLTVTDRPEDERYDLVTVVLADLGGDRTEMTFEQRGHMSPEQYRAAEDGWGTFFERMAERLQTR